jgi:hypothetical protein
MIFKLFKKKRKSLHEYQNLVNKGESKILAIDFDGVIHSNELGFHDGTVYGTPIKGVEQALEELSKKYTLIIHTSKANPNRPLINGKTGKELIWEWLGKYKLNSYITNITYDKINASYYIDDKAIHFTNWSSVLKKIK